jgi:hypothetical protein
MSWDPDADRQEPAGNLRDHGLLILLTPYSPGAGDDADDDAWAGGGAWHQTILIIAIPRRYPTALRND